MYSGPSLALRSQNRLIIRSGFSLDHFSGVRYSSAEVEVEVELADAGLDLDVVSGVLVETNALDIRASELRCETATADLSVNMVIELF